MIIIVHDQREIDVMVLRLASHAESPGLDVGKDYAYKLSKGGGVESWDALIATAFRVSSKDTIAAD